MSIDEKSWYRLDNTGNLYPSVLSRRNTTLFRLSLRLRDAVQIDRLSRAVEPVMRRFPYYRVQLRPGAFWYSLEENPRLPRPVIDSLSPCGYMPIKKRGVFPFRIRSYGSNLSVEFSHALTDGTGALHFLLSLLAAYRLEDPGLGSNEAREIRRELGADPTILLFDEEGNYAEPAQEEQQDAFRHYYDRHVPAPDEEKKVFHLKGTDLPSHGYRVLTGEMPVAELIAKAKGLGVSLTEYLTAIYFQALQEIQLRRARRGESTGRGPSRRAKRAKIPAPISVMVPVNLRRILPSRTMRNYFLTLNPLLDTRLGSYDPEEITAKVHHFMRIQLDHRHLSQQISRNVKGTVHPFIRLSPLFVKNIALKSIYRDYGESRYSGSLSNLGSVKLPSSLQPMVERVTFVPPPSQVLKKKAGGVSYGDTLSVSFGSLIEETALERIFFTHLRRAGVPVRVRGNWKGGDD